MTACTVPELQGEVSSLRRQLEAKQRELDAARRELGEPPELRGHKTWGVSELGRVLYDTKTTGELLPTDITLLICLYSMCVWPAEAAPPEATSTPPISYDFLGAKVSLGRSGVEKAVRRLKERGWLETTRDPGTGYLVYTLEVGRMLDDLAAWGTWTTQDAKATRPPSRRSTVLRGQRWESRSPALPASPRSKPRSPEAARLIREWRRTWLGTADPTAAINRLLGEGIGEKEIRRAMRSMDNLARPRPEYLADRVARTEYQRPRRRWAGAEPALALAEAPAEDTPEPQVSASPEPAEATFEPTAAPDPFPERPTEAERQRLGDRWRRGVAALFAGEPDRSKPPSRSAVAPPGAAGRGHPPDPPPEATTSPHPSAGAERPGVTGSRGVSHGATPRNWMRSWTTSDRAINTGSGHVPERVRADIQRTGDPPMGEGEL